MMDCLLRCCWVASRVGETELTEQLKHLFEQISELGWTVGDVWGLLARFRRSAASPTAGRQDHNHHSVRF